MFYFPNLEMAVALHISEDAVCCVFPGYMRESKSSMFFIILWPYDHRYTRSNLEKNYSSVTE